MKDETINATIAKQYTDWLVKTGGYARDMTMRDHFAGLAMQSLTNDRYCDKSRPTTQNDTACLSYQIADAMLKERNK